MLFFSDVRYVEEPVWIDSRVILDCIAFAETMSADEIKLCSIKPRGEELTDDNYAMANHRLPGFSLQERRLVLVYGGLPQRCPL